MSWLPDKPYNDLPPLPPKQDVETKRVLKRCIEARTALAELKQSAELIPNPIHANQHFATFGGKR